MQEYEEVLEGGNINQVVKVGETVRRSAKPNVYVHELLLHLQQRELPYFPKYLGQDDQGREILSYLDGEVPGDRYPEIDPEMWSEEALVKIGQILRIFHDATVGFVSSGKSANDYPDKKRHEVVCHNDAALYNVVFKDKLPAGLIDFDMAGAGPRIWDIAYTLYTSVPLASFSPHLSTPDVIPYESERHAALRRQRIQRFFASYGMSIPVDLKNWVISRIKFMCSTLSERAAAGDPAFVRLVEEGHLAHYEREVEFLERHFADWL